MEIREGAIPVAAGTPNIMILAQTGFRLWQSHRITNPLSGRQPRNRIPADGLVTDALHSTKSCGSGKPHPLLSADVSSWNSARRGDSSTFGLAAKTVGHFGEHDVFTLLVLRNGYDSVNF